MFNVILTAREAIKEADFALLSPPLPTSPSSNIPDKVIMAALSPPQQKRAKLDRGGAKQVVHWRLQLSSMYFVYRPYVFAYVTQLKSTYLLTKVELYGCTFKGG